MSAVIYAMIAAFANVAGGVAVVLGARQSLRLIEGLVAFGAGFMLAVALVEVLPEAYHMDEGTAALFVLIGYLLVHLSQHTVTHHFHFGEETHHVSRRASFSGLIGILLHTFFDGVAIASGFLVNQELGILLFLAVLFHKLPEGVTITSLQLAGGSTATRALTAAAVTGLATVAGVILTDQVAWLAAHGLALSAGVTIYVAASDLVPEFQQKSGVRLPLAFFVGAGFVFLAKEALTAMGLGH